MFVMKQSNTCGFETMVMSVKCWSFDIRNPQVHIPTETRETVGLSTYKAFNLTLDRALPALSLWSLALKRRLTWR